MSELLDEVDRFANELLGTVSSKTKEVLAALLDWHDLWELLKGLSWFFGLALVGSSLVYVFFVINPDLTWLEVILAFAGMLLLSFPLGFLGLLSWVIVGGIAMLGGGILLKMIVVVGRLGRSALTQLRSEGERR